MNTRWTVSLAASSAVLLWGAVLATAAEPSMRQGQSAMLGSTGIIRISTLVGTTVLDPQGQKLGQIKDVILDSQTGQATFVALDAEVPTTGHAMLVVPYRALWVSFNPVDKRQSVVLNLRPDQFRAAPQIQNDQWQLLQNPQFLEQARSFYHIKTYAGASPTDKPSMTYSVARPIDNPPSMPSPSIQYAVPPCVDFGPPSDGLTRDQESFYNE